MDDAFRARLEQIGHEQVRRALSAGGWSQNYDEVVLWLKEEDDKALAIERDFKLEDRKIAESAKNAAWASANAAQSSSRWARIGIIISILIGMVNLAVTLMLNFYGK